MIFFKNKWQIENALHVTSEFSEASGLKLNINKTEILCLYENEEQFMCNISVKHHVEYLGIHISKDMTLRQQLKFNFN